MFVIRELIGKYIKKETTRMNSPIGIIIFNRPDLTEKVFAEIAGAKPAKLFIIADGPRADRPADIEKCAAARAVVERVNWKCDILRKYSDVNRGCGITVAEGISWVFEHTDRAIILEDDCIPHQDFFRFCDELLERYLDDERIMQINGNNFQFGQTRGPFSYFFSHHNICWGWATWRRAWKYYDIGVKLWPELKETGWLHNIVNNAAAERYWAEQFDRASASVSNADFWTWDYQWTFACWAQNGLAISPNTTLISNVGFGSQATHTFSPGKTAYLATGELQFPLRHPPHVIRDAEADRYFIENVVVPKNAPHKKPFLPGLLQCLRRR